MATAIERDPNEGPPKGLNAKIPFPKKAKNKNTAKTKTETSTSTSEIEDENLATNTNEDFTVEGEVVDMDDDSEGEASPNGFNADIARIFAIDPTPTPVPQLDPDSELFFTQVDELNEYFHQLKQPPAPTPTVAPLRPPLEPPRIVFKAMLKKGAVMQDLDDPAKQHTTQRDYFVQVAMDDYKNPLIVLDRQGIPRFKTSRRYVVDLSKDLDFKLSPLTNNPQQAWLKEELRRNDPAPTFIHRIFAGIGESTLQRTNIPDMAMQSMFHAALEYQLLFSWPFPVRLGLVSSVNYEKYQQFTWPSWSIGPIATYHIIWGQQQFELLALWQSLFYSRLRFMDLDLDTTPTLRGTGSFWQVGLNYFLILRGKVFPVGVFYQRGSYNFEQNKDYTNYDVENTTHRMHAIGLRLGWQWD